MHSRIGGDEAAREHDHIARRGSAPDCQLLAVVPDEERTQSQGHDRSNEGGCLFSFARIPDNACESDAARVGIRDTGPKEECFNWVFLDRLQASSPL